MSAPLRAIAVLGKSNFSRFFLDIPKVNCNTSRHGVVTLASQYGAYRGPDSQSRHVTAHSGPVIVPVRNVSFLTKMTGGELWDGVLGVSNAGKKRGRGRRVGRKKNVDLNKGQIIGTGRANIMWPGLNSAIIKGREVMSQQQLPPNPDYESQLVKMRDEQSRIKYPRTPPLIRGYSGSRFPGQSIGPPDPVADYKFEGFDSRVLEFKVVANMTGTLGRKHSFTAFVCVGNGNGLAGYGQGKAKTGRAAIRVAKNRAAQRLFYIERYNDHTVFHNMYNKYLRTKLFIHKREEDYGLKCHRVLKTICTLIGIKDLHCKVEGSTTNIKAITKGFFEALTKQETHQQLADRTGYHIVEMRKDRGDFPTCVATPTHGIVQEKPLQDEDHDLELAFERLYFNGKTEAKKPKYKPTYHKQNSYHKKSRVVARRRNQEEAQLLRWGGMW